MMRLIQKRPERQLVSGPRKATSKGHASAVYDNAIPHAVSQLARKVLVRGSIMKQGLGFSWRLLTGLSEAPFVDFAGETEVSRAFFSGCLGTGRVGPSCGTRTRRTGFSFSARDGSAGGASGARGGAGGGALTPRLRL